MEDLKNNVTQVELLVKSLRYRRRQLRQINKLRSKITTSPPLNSQKEFTEGACKKIDKIHSDFRRTNCPLCKYIEETYPLYRSYVSFKGDCKECLAGDTTNVCEEFMCNSEDAGQYISNRTVCLRWLTRQINKWNKHLKRLKNKKKAPVKLNVPFARTMRTW